MRISLAIIILVGILQSARAQDQYLWIKLSGNRVLLNVEPEWIAGDSLVVLRESRTVFVPIGEIEQIRIMEEGSIVEGAALGAGIGLVVGGTAGALAKDSDGKHLGVGATALTVGIIGGIIGSVAGSGGGAGEAVNLAGASIEERKDLLNCLLLQKQDR